MSHQNDIIDIKEIARRRADPKVTRKLIEIFGIVALGFFLHECGHILIAYLVGFDMTGWYFYPNFPFLSWRIPAAPSSSAAPLEWFLVRLAGPLMEGTLYLGVGLKKSKRHFLFLAFFAFVYSIIESMGLLMGVYKTIMLLFATSMILCAALWMVRTTDSAELALVKSELESK